MPKTERRGQGKEHNDQWFIFSATALRADPRYRNQLSPPRCIFAISTRLLLSFSDSDTLIKASSGAPKVQKIYEIGSERASLDDGNEYLWIFHGGSLQKMLCCAPLDLLLVPRPGSIHREPCIFSLTSSLTLESRPHFGRHRVSQRKVINKGRIFISILIRFEFEY